MNMTGAQAERLFELQEKIVDYKDLFLPPTLVTTASLALVLNGCRSIETISGVNQIAAGRSGDLLDGYLARLLDQSSDLGALADTIADKIGMAAIVGAAWRKQAVPRPVLATIGAKQIINPTLTAIHAYRHPTKNFRPVRTGKLAMAADNVAVLGHLYANAFEKEYPDEPAYEHFRQIGDIAFKAGAALSVPTTIEYTRRIFTD